MIDNSVFDDMEILPFWLQKLIRIIKLVMIVNFISGSNYLSIADHLLKNKTFVYQNAMTVNDRIFASRQEIFSLIHVIIKSLLLVFFVFRK